MTSRRAEENHSELCRWMNRRERADIHLGASVCGVVAWLIALNLYNSRWPDWIAYGAGVLGLVACFCLWATFAERDDAIYQAAYHRGVDDGIRGAEEDRKAATP